MAPKMDQKPLKITSEIDLDFNRLFQRFFDRFFASFVPAELQKTYKNCRFLQVFHFFDIFLLLVFSILFGSFFCQFFVDFSVKNRRKIDTESNQKMKDFLNGFSIDLGGFWPPFWSPGVTP